LRWISRNSTCIDDAAVGLEEFVGNLKDRKDQRAFGTPGRMPATGLAPDIFAGPAGHAFHRTFLVDQGTFEHISLLDIDMLMVGQHRTRREAHQRRHQPGSAIEQQRFRLAAGKARLLPSHILGLDEVRMVLRDVASRRRSGIHRWPP
jgi:hypothetical protein